jgi:hypothetical protein
MSTNTHSADESIDLDDRDARALTEYLTVLSDIGRAKDAEDLYLVVSQSGREYLVDAREEACECADARHRNPENGCKHVRRVAFATGEREIPTWVDGDDVDPQLGEHVVTADGGKVEWSDVPDYTEHIEPPEQGGEKYVRCEGCGRELLECLGGREKLAHVDGCPLDGSSS